jgi:hypothetical protein
MGGGGVCRPPPQAPFLLLTLRTLPLPLPAFSSTALSHAAVAACAHTSIDVRGLAAFSLCDVAVCDQLPPLVIGTFAALRPNAFFMSAFDGDNAAPQPSFPEDLPLFSRACVRPRALQQSSHRRHHARVSRRSLTLRSSGRPPCSDPSVLMQRGPAPMGWAVIKTGIWLLMSGAITRLSLLPRTL